MVAFGAGFVSVAGFVPTHRGARPRRALCSGTRVPNFAPSSELPLRGVMQMMTTQVLLEMEQEEEKDKDGGIGDVPVCQRSLLRTQTPPSNLGES